MFRQSNNQAEDEDSEEDMTVQFGMNILQNQSTIMEKGMGNQLGKQGTVINKFGKQGTVMNKIQSREEAKNGAVVSDNKSDEFVMRTISIARPSIKDDTLTVNDKHSGFMEKQSPSLLKHWQKRFFVLEHKKLKYYKSEQDYT